MYDDALAPTALRATQFTLLCVVRGQRRISVKALGAALDLDRTTTGKNLQPLERMGLVEVTRSPADARSRVVAMTPAGLEVLSRADALWRQAQTDFEQANGQAKAVELRDVLASLK